MSTELVGSCVGWGSGRACGDGADGDFVAVDGGDFDFVVAGDEGTIGDYVEEVVVEAGFAGGGSRRGVDLG